MNKKGFDNNTSNLEWFSSLQNKLINLIEISKQEYLSKIAKTLSDLSISSKASIGLFHKVFQRVQRFLVFLLSLMKKKLLLT